MRGRDGDPDVLAAEAGAVGEGRFLAIGDASVFINSMLRFPGNRTLGRAVVRYATDDDTWGKRHGRVVVVVNHFDQMGTFGEDATLLDRMSEWQRTVSDALRHVRTEGMPASVAYVLAVLIGLGIVIWVGMRAGKLHRAARPRFTRQIPMFSQGGIAGHAAVLGAGTTPRSLGLLELKNAVEEALSDLLGENHNVGMDELLRRASADKLLTQEELSTLRALLIRMAKVESNLALHRKLGEGVHDRDVIAAASVVRRILESAAARPTSRPVSRPATGERGGVA